MMVIYISDRGKIGNASLELKRFYPNLLKATLIEKTIGVFPVWGKNYTPCEVRPNAT